jgi:hypothetical protein
MTEREAQSHHPNTSTQKDKPQPSLTEQLIDVAVFPQAKSENPTNVSLRELTGDPVDTLRKITNGRHAAVIARGDFFPTFLVLPLDPGRVAGLLADESNKDAPKDTQARRAELAGQTLYTTEEVLRSVDDGTSDPEGK